MSEIRGRPLPLGGAQPAAADAQRIDNERWHELVAAVGAEVAAPLTSALERVVSLSATGRIDRNSLRLLREEIEQARQAGMTGQQLTRFASGNIRQSPERMPLADVFGGVLAHRTRETQARGICLKPMLEPAEVMVDASLLFSLLNTTLDWALANARSRIDFMIDHKPWSADARLTCRFAHVAAERVHGVAAAAAPPVSKLDSLVWRLLEQTAWTMGLAVERKDAAGITTLTFEFPCAAKSEESQDISALELDDGFAPSANTQPLAGSHVLVIASRREMRQLIRDALRNMSLIVDFVNSVDEAASFCREGLPHAIIIESIQSGERFAALRDEISVEVPGFVFIEIVEQGSNFEMSGFGGASMARVGRDVLTSSLPSALMFELSKTL